MRARGTVERIVAKGEPVYGINTGFGKLASVRIGNADLASLQRNIVLSHAAGTGEPHARAGRAPDDGAQARKPRRRAPPASDGRPSSILDAMLRPELIPVIPSQGSVGASGDLAPLAHMAAAMMGVGELHRRRCEQCLRPRRSQRQDCRSLSLGPKEGLALLNGTQVLDGTRALQACSRPSAPFAPRSSPGALSTDAAKGSDAPFDPRIQALRAAPRPDRGGAAPCAG